MSFRNFSICFALFVTVTLSAADKTKLSVALFPYLPSGTDISNEALRSRLESEFQASHPEIDLELRKFDPYEDDFYDPFWVAGLLKGGVDVVEIDTVILGSLLDSEAISAWPIEFEKADWQPIAMEACRFQGQVFGIPHWMCGYFVIARHESVAEQAR